VLLNKFVAELAGADAIWIAFQAWAVYFLAGCNLLGGIRALIGYATGIVASIAILALMSAPGISDLPPWGGMNFVMAVAVFIVVIPAIMSEKVKNMIPALFIGSGAFFGLLFGHMGETATQFATQLDAARVVFVYCAYGLLFGFITVFWRGMYEASLKSKTQ
jgi:hypothetical protein